MISQESTTKDVKLFDYISFGSIKLVNQDLVKKIVAKSMRAWALKHKEELIALKQEFGEVKTC